MIRTVKILFCDNEHGTGDVTFPDIRDFTQHAIVEGEGATAKGLRKAVKTEGWGRINGGDYCPQCMESGI